MKLQTKFLSVFLLFQFVYIILLQSVSFPTSLHDVSDTGDGVLRVNDILSGFITSNDDRQAAEYKTKNRAVCLNTRHLLKSTEHIDSAYKQLDQFHNGGGNLKIIETFLNEQMDPTLALLGATFTPNGSKDPIPPEKSIVKEIRHLLKAQDKNKRGGYNQRKIPGDFNTDPNMKALRSVTKPWEKSIMFDVIEPHSMGRWEKGVGPTPDICRHQDKILAPWGTKGRWHKSKFMCSYPGKRRSGDDGTNHENSGTTLNGDQQCNMISVGSNREWDFEESISKETNCTTHTFDCTTAANPMKPAVDSIHYYPYCLAKEFQTVDGNEYLTYFGMTEKIGLTKAPDLLKMDVEGFEFDIFTQMLDHAEQTNSKHLLPSQISTELHFSTRMYDLDWHLRMRQTAEIAMFAGMMYNRGGYVLTHIKLYSGCPSCADVLFVRVFCD